MGMREGVEWALHSCLNLAEIRQRGPGAGMPDNCRAPCTVSHAMRRAGLIWRRELAGQTLADIKATAERTAPGVPARVRRWLADAGV